MKRLHAWVGAKHEVGSPLTKDSFLLSDIWVNHANLHGLYVLTVACIPMRDHDRPFYQYNGRFCKLNAQTTEQFGFIRI